MKIWDSGRGVEPFQAERIVGTKVLCVCGRGGEMIGEGWGGSGGSDRVTVGKIGCSLPEEALDNKLRNLLGSI